MIDPRSFGRAMMSHAVNMSSDRDCNDFARVGNKLVNMGNAGFPKNIYSFDSEDMEIINKALTLLDKVSIV